MKKAYAVLLLVIISTGIFSYFYFFESGSIPEIPIQPPEFPQPPPSTNPLPELQFAVTGAEARRNGWQVRKYNELTQEYTGEQSPDLIFCVNTYILTGNKTHLELAIGTAENLDWTAFTSCSCLVALLNLYKITGKFKDKCIKVTDWIIQRTPYKDISRTSSTIQALSYSYYVLGYEPAKAKARKIIDEWPRSSSTGMIYRYYDRSADYLKEDEDYGLWMIALFTYWKLTGDDSIASFIHDQALKGCQYFWDSAHQRFNYRIIVETGQLSWNIAVHGFGIIDTAMFWAYSEFGDEILKDRALKDLETNVIKGEMLSNLNLIYHGTGGSPNDSSLPWNVWSVLALNYAYTLTGDIRYKQKAEAIYQAHLKYHKAKYGYVHGVDADKGTIRTDYSYYPKDASINLIFLFCAYMKETTPDFDGLQYCIPRLGAKL